MPENRKITQKEAVALLLKTKAKNKLRVHSFTSAFGCLMGCDMDLSSIKKGMKGAGEDIYISGPRMKALGHCVCYWDTKNLEYIFLETDRVEMAKFERLHPEPKNAILDFRNGVKEKTNIFVYNKK